MATQRARLINTLLLATDGFNGYPSGDPNAVNMALDFSDAGLGETAFYLAPAAAPVDVTINEVRLLALTMFVTTGNPAGLNPFGFVDDTPTWLTNGIAAVIELPAIRMPKAMDLFVDEVPFKGHNQLSFPWMKTVFTQEEPGGPIIQVVHQFDLTKLHGPDGVAIGPEGSVKFTLHDDFSGLEQFGVAAHVQINGNVV